MTKDELEEINGLKPKVVLQDGEEREVSSLTSNSVYKVKRTIDHFYCTCPAWRNQGGVPVNARTCKHLKGLLGDKYEEARVKMKNPDVPPPKGAAKSKPASKAKAKAKAAPKKMTNDEGDDDENENEKKPRSRKAGARSASAKPASKAKTKPVSKISSKRKRHAVEDDEEGEDEDDEDEDEDQPPAKRGRRTAAPSSKGKGKQKDEEAEDDDDVDVDDNEDDEDTAPSSGKAIPELLLANKWDLEKGPDPTGWWISEKLDGVRTYYDGKQFISRLGNPFTPPNWFLDKLPKDITLDGELYGGRGEFQSTVSIVKTVNSVHWKNITFQIFDVPSRGEETFEERFKYLQDIFGENGTLKADQIVVVQHEQATSRDHVLEKLKEIESLGGEGLMLRKPGSTYEGRRSGTLLKIKTFYDAEAIVTGYAPGKGRNKGSTGALKCKMESGKLFNVGSGLTDKIRKNPPKIGSIIVYRFQELTRDRVPRFPSYVGEAVDKTAPKDAEIPEHRKTTAEEA